MRACRLPRRCVAWVTGVQWPRTERYCRTSAQWRGSPETMAGDREPAANAGNRVGQARVGTQDAWRPSGGEPRGRVPEPAHTPGPMRVLRLAGRAPGAPEWHAPQDRNAVAWGLVCLHA